MKRKIICQRCKKNKDHYAHGICHACYIKGYSNKYYKSNDCKTIIVSRVTHNTLNEIKNSQKFGSLDDAILFLIHKHTKYLMGDDLGNE